MAKTKKKTRSSASKSGKKAANTKKKTKGKRGKRKTPPSEVLPGGKDWVILVTTTGDHIKISKADASNVTKHKWRVIRKEGGQKSMVIANMLIKGRMTTVTLGKFIMKPPKGKHVYPRRFVAGMDYRRSNLIVCTLKERQAMSPRLQRKGSSKYKGVDWVPRHRKWRARITKNGKSISLGLHNSQEEAAEAYNRAAIDVFGEFAYQNRIDLSKERRKKKA